MKVRNWRNGTIFSIVSILALTVTAFLVGASGNQNDSDTEAPASSENSELIALLTVDTTVVNCAELVGDDAVKTLEDGRKIIPFDFGALKPVEEGGRKWSDALSTPLIANQPTDALKEIQTAICLDPLLGVSLAHLFAHFTVDDVKIVDLNDWLKPFEVDADLINDLAAEFAPLLDVANPSDEQVSSAINQNLIYQGLAEKLGTMLTRFSIVGIQSARSVLNYHLAGGGLVVGGLPEVALNATQEGLPALVLEVNMKPGVCLARIGFNTGDKRPEVFGCPFATTPTTSNPTGSTTPPTSPPTTVPGGKDASERPAQDPVISCPSGQYADRNTGNCTSGGDSPPPTYNNSGGDSGPGAPGPGVSTPPTDPAPDPTVPTNTGPGDGYLPDPNV